MPLHTKKKKITQATYGMAYIYGKGGKPYSDAKIIKDCIIEAVSGIISEKINKIYKKVPLSRQTITHWQREFAHNTSKQLYKRCQSKDVLYSIALNESTDIKQFGTSVVFYLSCNFGFLVF